MAVFAVEVRNPSVEGSFYGESYISTDHNQTLRIPFRFAVSKGCVYSDPVVFDKAFPVSNYKCCCKKRIKLYCEERLFNELSVFDYRERSQRKRCI